jgi:hypothetical protein
MTTRVSTSVLANTAVTPGTYGGGVTSSSSQVPVITVDQQGRLTSAANVTVTSTSIYANTGQLTANAAVGVVSIGLPTTLSDAAAALSYGSASQTPVISVDKYGRIIGINAATVSAGGAGVGATSYTRTTFTLAAVTSVFTVSYTVGYLQVYHNGVLLPSGDYTASNGTSVTLSVAGRIGDIIEFLAYSVTLVNNVSPTSAAATPGGEAGTVLYQSAANTTSNTAVGTTTYLLQSNGSAAPTWVNPGSLSVNIANTSTSITGTTSNTQFFSVGVGTAASTTGGEIRATNNITAYYSSDKKFKENVQDIPNALEKVDAIGGKLFDWTDEYIQEHGGEDGYFIQKSDFGVIAQDVQSVFPLATRTRTDGSLAVDYEKLCALAFAAIKELKNEVEVLKGQIK